MIRNLDDEDEVKGYEEQGIRVFKGRASLQGPGKVRVGRRTLHGDRLVIATGSEADIPPIEGLAASGYWTNREATTLIQVPDSAVVLGGGPVGISSRRCSGGSDLRWTCSRHPIRCSSAKIRESVSWSWRR